jgi:hypothetical protein
VKLEGAIGFLGLCCCDAVQFSGIEGNDDGRKPGARKNVSMVYLFLTFSCLGLAPETETQ